MENLLDEESNALGRGPSFAVQQFCDLGQIIPLSSIKKGSLSSCWAPSTGQGTRDTMIPYGILLAFQEFRAQWEVCTSHQIIARGKYYGRR